MTTGVRDEEGYTNVTDRESTAQSRVSTCERCGEYREGRSKLMIYRLMERFPAPPIARQFFLQSLSSRYEHLRIRLVLIAGNATRIAYRRLTVGTLWA